MSGAPVEFVDRYRAAGLLGNPFAHESVGGEGVEGGEGAAWFVDRGLPDPPPAGSGTLVQILGDKGAGKTTQVMHWRRRSRGPYHYVPQLPRRARWLAPPVAPLVYADEIDRMPATLRRRWFGHLARARSTLVAGTHDDLAAPARRAGLAVVTHHLGPADIATFRQVVERRLRHASVSPSTVPQLLSEEDVVDVHARSGGNLRLAEWLLHEVIADRVRSVEPARLT